MHRSTVANQRDAIRLGKAVPSEGSDNSELINERLKSKKLFLGNLKPTPRRYQTELARKAIEGNAIIYLGTGLGKTYITVVFLESRRVAQQIRSGLKVVFMAPTQDLIEQQAEYINKHVPYRVKIFAGLTARRGLRIIHRWKDDWESELKQVDLLFMTPQIFCNAISTGLLSWSQFAAVIFDEFHHACPPKKKGAGSPYYQSLAHYKAFYSVPTRADTPRPRLIGLTATLINLMPKNRDDIEKQVLQLERMFYGMCYTDIEAQESKPTIVIHRFSSPQINRENDLLTSMLENLAENLEKALKVSKAGEIRNRHDRVLTAEQIKISSFDKRLNLAAMGFSMKPSSFPMVLQGMAAIRQRCGLWQLRSVCSMLINVIEKHCKSNSFKTEVKPIYVSFADILRRIYHTLEWFLARKPDEGLLSYTRPKSRALLDVLKREHKRIKDGPSAKESFSCIVFVKSRLEVVAVNKWLQALSSISEYSFLRSDYAIGVAATLSCRYACITRRKPSEQSAMLNRFRNGLLNVIVTTSALGEGIDLPLCSSVIRYDLPENFREYVQSRGRARQAISDCVFLCELEKSTKVREDLDKYNDGEITLKNLLSGRRSIPQTVHQQARASEKEFDNDLDTDDSFMAKDNSILISSSTARNILSMYCNWLAKNAPFTEGARYDRIQPTANTSQTILYLPSGCPLNDGIKGRPKSNRELSDNSAAVAAVRSLYDAGELNEHGIPTRVSEKTIDSLLETQDLNIVRETLDKSLEGQKVLENGQEIYRLFTPKLLHVGSALHVDCARRTYKLLRLRFTAVPEKAREETRPFFEQPTYGLIVDSRISNDFVPESLFGHYGQFTVESKQICENWSIAAAADHRHYMNYTYKFLTTCLSIRGVDKDAFQNSCQFYVLPLDNNHRPDLRRMRSSFGTSQGSGLQRGHVVKLQQSDPGNNVSRHWPYDNRPMLVRAIRDDMSAHSLIPGQRTKTILTEAEEVHGKGVVIDSRQRVIEVMPLSKEFASTDEWKKAKRECFTESLFYLEQFLEPFDSDAASVLQAFLMPEIIYQLYLSYTAHELHDRFKGETASRRDHDEERRSCSQPSELVLDRKELSESELEHNLQVGGDDELGFDNSKNHPAGDEFDEHPERDSDGDLEGDADENSDADSNISSESSHSTHDDDLAQIEPNYSDLLPQRTLNLDNDDSDEENLKRSDLSQSEEKNLNSLNYLTQDSVNPDSTEEDAAQSAIDFDRLNDEVNAMQYKLIDRLESIWMRSDRPDSDLDDHLDHQDLDHLDQGHPDDKGDLDDQGYLNGVSELQKRQAKVDRSVEPPLTFDRGQGILGRQPLLKGSIVEALTQRRAEHGHSLEGMKNVGDSFLKYIVSVVLYKRLEGNEGMLTAARMRLTCNDLFCHLAKKKRLGEYAITGALNSKEESSLPFLFGRTLSENERQSLSNQMRPKGLADLFKSLIGGYLLYKGEFEAILAVEWLGLDIFKEEIFDEFHADGVVFSKQPTALLDADNEQCKKYYKGCKIKYRRFEEIIGYEFNDASFLVQAFCHASSNYRCTRSYERLEFLGDSILDYLTLMTLVKFGCKFEPGQLDLSRSSLVNNYTIARLALKYKYDLFILHANSELYDELAKVRLAMEEDPEMTFIDMIDFDRVVKLLADVFESVAGAIYLDSGNSLDTVWSIYYPMMKELIDNEIRSPTKNIVAQLYELFPGRNRIQFETYDVKTWQGDSVGVKCSIVGFGEFEGSGISRKQARQRAVREAMRQPPSPELKARLDAEYQAKLGPIRD